MNNALIIGKNGYLGAFLKETLDLRTDETREDYEYVINCAAYTDVDGCEINIAKSYQSNVLLVGDIIDKWPHAKLIHFSTYYVYNDDKPCTEDGPTTDGFTYAAHKLAGEHLAITKLKTLVFRLGKLFGKSSGKQPHRLTEHILEANELLLDDIKFNPTSLQQIARAVKHELENHNMFGIYNLANEGTPTHYEWGVKINDILGTDKKIVKSPVAQRSLPNYGKFLMDTSKIKRHIMLEPWENDLYTYLSEQAINRR